MVAYIRSSEVKWGMVLAGERLIREGSCGRGDTELDLRGNLEFSRETFLVDTMAQRCRHKGSSISKGMAKIFQKLETSAETECA